MAIKFPPLTLPPRPPELPAVPPPKGQGDPFLRNDAFLAVWIDEFERVIKDAWFLLRTLVEGIEARITVLETRIADTYTYGQKGALALAAPPEEGEPVSLSLLALPLRVVRDEEILELTAACETPSEDTTTVLTVQHIVDTVSTTVGTLTLGTGITFVPLVLPAPKKVKKNEVLRVEITEASETAADFVVQIRCR